MILSFEVMLVHLRISASRNVLNIGFDGTVYSRKVLQSHQISGLVRGLPLIMYAPRGAGWAQASYTFPLCITCEKWVGGSR